MTCCGPSLSRGVASGGGGAAAREFLFRIAADLVSVAVFPTINNLIAQALAPNLLAVDGEMIVMKLGGNVQNADAAARTVSPFIGIDTVFGWGGTSANIGAGVTAAWDCDIMITRKSAATFTLAGRMQVHNANTPPVNGIGVPALANLGGPIAALNADPACDWTIAQTLRFNMTSSGANTSFRIKSGYAEVLR